MSSFRAYVWDPVLLISQMISMQGAFYVSLSSVLLSASLLGYNTTLAYLFPLQISKLSVVCQLLASIACSLAMATVVQRARQCLDFACTLHLFHLVAYLVYTHTFPSTVSWWMLQFASIVLCTVLGEYFCMKVESREIKLVGQPSKYDL